MFYLEEFNGNGVKITQGQFNAMRPLLLKTGKFIEVDGELINISDIKSLKKVPEITSENILKYI